MSKLNLEKYNYEDFYTYLPLKNADKDSFKMAVENDKFSFEKYMLNPNFLKWFDFEPEAEVLEVNACLGGLTEILCDKVKSVTVIEFSKNTAEIINERLSDKENLEIIVGKLKNITLKKKFDYIILNDILEFAGVFFNKSNPPKLFLKYFKKLLKPSGKIIVSISNRYGIKNWEGGKNEHSFETGDEINSFPQASEVNSYTQKELENIFNNAGFKNLQILYPAPNHHQAEYILSENNLNYFSPFSFKDYIFASKNIFGEADIIDDIYKNNEFSFFANSFLIIANNNKTEQEEQVIFSRINEDKITNYITDKNNNLCIKKYNYKDIKQPKSINNTEFLKYNKDKNNCFISEKISGKSLKTICLEYIKENRLDMFESVLQEYISILNALYKDKEFRSFEWNGTILPYTTCVKNTNIDLNFNTIFKNEDKYCILEYDNVSEEYIPFYYLVFESFYDFHNARYNLDIYDYLIKFGLYHDEIILYKQMAENKKLK